jgi:RimJ/RimL family protein N-acetyltransferase
VNGLFGAPPRSLPFPAEGTVYGGLTFRLPTEDDVEAVAPAFLDEELAGAANMPPLDERALREALPRLPEVIEQGLFLPLLVVDDGSGAVQGGANLHHFDWERGQCEIGYWLFEHARGKGIATRTARFIADYGFSLGLERIEARVVVGNVASERVLERAGFTREGVLRSMPLRRGGRVDMTVFSLLPGE